MTKTAPKAGDLPVTLATWLYILFDRGEVLSSAALREACEALSAGIAQPDADMEALGKAMVAVVEAELGGTADFESVKAYVDGMLGEGRVSTSFGDDRDSRARQARRYQFAHNLPWMATIIDRFPDGSVGAHWVMVEQMTDTVTCMDPYPWDDLDEEYDAPVNDFMVKWELAGSDCLYLG